MRVLLSLLLTLLFATTSLSAQSTVTQRQTQRVKHAYNASGALYGVNADGMHFDCSAVAFEKTPKGYRWFTSAHCIIDGKEGSVIEHSAWFITPDDKTFYPAKVVALGNELAGDDAAVLEIETTNRLSVGALSTRTIPFDTPVIVTGRPGNMGFQVFRGRVAGQVTDPDSKPFGIYGYTLVQSVVARGSSGGGVYSLRDGRIVGIVNAMSPVVEGVAICMPIKRFIAFYEAVKKGTYQWQSLTPQS